MMFLHSSVTPRVCICLTRSDRIERAASGFRLPVKTVGVSAEPIKKTVLVHYGFLPFLMKKRRGDEPKISSGN